MKRLLAYIAVVIFILGCSPETILSEDLAESVPNLPAQSTSLSTEESLLLWISSMQASNGLIESAEHTDFVSLYDNALAALVFIESGNPSKAFRILNYFHSRLEEEFQSSGGGFYQFRNLQGLERSRIWVGDNLWLILAMKHYQETYESTHFENSIYSLETWVRGLQDIDGGLWGGWEDDGRRIPKVTEGMLTAYALISGYDEFHRGLGAFMSKNRWDPENEVLLAEDAPGPYAHALDLHSLYALYWKNASSPALTSAARFYSETEHSLHRVLINGYCFDEDRDVIWLEGSAQMALAYRVNGWSDEYLSNMENLEKSLVPSTRHPGLSAMPYAANHGSSFGAVPLWDHADDTPAISASCWTFFALKGFNPMAAPGGQKPIVPQAAQ